MNTQITTIVNNLPADLFAATEFLRTADFYQTQLENEDNLANNKEENLAAAKNLNMSVFEGLVGQATDEEDRTDLVKYIAASIGCTTSTIYTDGVHAVLVAKDKNIENMEKIASAFRVDNSDYNFIFKDEDGVLNTVAGIYNLNDGTVTLAVPHHMAMYQAEATELNRDYFLDLLNKDEKLKAEVEAYMAQFN